MRANLDQMLKKLTLGRMAEILPTELTRAREKKASYEDFLERLLTAQFNHRQETALAWRIHKAKLPELWSLDTFPYDQQPGLDERRIRELEELDFIHRVGDVKEPCAPTTTNFVHLRGRGGADGLTKSQVKVS
jgi:DNA replication protein DnaC